jgi:hypothetical protein
VDGHRVIAVEAGGHRLVQQGVGLRRFLGDSSGAL